MRLGPEFRWPGGKQVAVLFNVAYEAWSDGKTPGIGPMGNPLASGHLDTNALSWATYGPVRGIGRLLDSLDRAGTKGSIMVNGVLAERYPDTVRAIVDRGHEALAHSYGMDVIPTYLSEEDERANIRKTTDLIAKASGGKAPTGWISPRGTPSRNTARLVAEAGYAWHGDAYDDDLPYVQTFGGCSIVAIPLTMEVNDMPLYVRYGNAPRQFLDVFNETMARLRKHERGAVMLDATVHTHVFGRPSGAWVFEEILEMVKGAGDVWTGTRAEVADHIRLATAKRSAAA